MLALLTLRTISPTAADTPCLTTAAAGPGLPVPTRSITGTGFFADLGGLVAVDMAALGWLRLLLVLVFVVGSHWVVWYCVGGLGTWDWREGLEEGLEVRLYSALCFQDWGLGCWPRETKHETSGVEVYFRAGSLVSASLRSTCTCTCSYGVMGVCVPDAVLFSLILLRHKEEPRDCHSNR